MIKTTDLMLGNYVVCRVGGKESEKRSIPMKVVALFDDCAYLDFDGNDGDVLEEYDKDLFGIEITEELLEKCGLKRIIRFGLVAYNDGTPQDEQGKLNAIYNGTEIGKGWFISNGDCAISVTYLHQLQNAYHLLTGKDLEVKL